MGWFWAETAPKAAPAAPNPLPKTDATPPVSIPIGLFGYFRWLIGALARLPYAYLLFSVAGRLSELMPGQVFELYYPKIRILFASRCGTGPISRKTIHTLQA
jgi:hypothetical protein